ncbi:MAG: LysR family transcriptional regulator [Cytophagales bacterium]|nr:LysR family transcriptional regulator [Cytophaga sp.]
MNLSIQQLLYFKYVVDTGSLTQAAAACFVSQPALSMQLKKMEDETGLILIDRSRQPMLPTEAGKKVYQYAQQILGKMNELEDSLSTFKDSVEGQLHIGIIPTLAPYLLPHFIGNFTKAYPKLQIRISELKTENIIRKINTDQLDAGILITPIKEPYIKEQPLFYEEFKAYIKTSDKKIAAKEFISMEELLDHRLWMLEEGNCFRDQTINLCGIAQTNYREGYFNYESGNIETLLRMVDTEGGVTLVPELATIGFNAKQQRMVKQIGKSAQHPVREVSLVYSREHHKKNLLDKLKSCIIDSLPDEVKHTGKIVPVIKK